MKTSVATWAIALAATLRVTAAWPKTTSTSTHKSSSSTHSTSTSHSTTSTSHSTTSTSHSTTSTTSAAATCACTATNSFTYRATVRDPSKNHITQPLMKAVSQFDDLVVDNPVTPLNDFINTYDSLYWQAMVLAPYTQGTPGVVPNSMPNVAAYSEGTVLEQGMAGIFANYTGSTISNFTLYQFYYGCILSVPQNVASVPTSCNFTMQGYNSKGAQVASQDFQYVAQGTIQQMYMAQVDSAFTQVAFVTFSEPILEETAVITQLDSFVYTVFGQGTLYGNS